MEGRSLVRVTDAAPGVQPVLKNGACGNGSLSHGRCLRRGKTRSGSVLCSLQDCSRVVVAGSDSKYSNLILTSSKGDN
jgi:hypothetical protein